MLEAIYDLFAGLLGSNLDLIDISMTSSGDRFDGSLYTTNNTFRSILANQPTPFVDLPFTQKFATAIESVGWPAEAFSMLLLQHDPIETSKRTNEHGQTALHWAAAHFGEWSRRGGLNSIEFNASQKIDDYAKLAIELVRTGANVHAVCDDSLDETIAQRWTKQIDPLHALLAGIRTNAIWAWTTKSLHDAVSRWGQILVEGGHHLVDYISTENEFLKSIIWKDPDYRFRALDADCPYVPVRLILSEHATLMLEIKKVPSVPIWEAALQSVPGAWPAAAMSSEVIAWEPQEMDSRDGLRWNLVRDIQIKSKPYEIGPSERPEKSLHNSLRFNAWKEARSNQDDHGFVARIHSRGSTGWRHRGARLGRRRSSSWPPSLLKDASVLFGGINTVGEHIASSSGYRYTIHKCPLDAQWRICGNDVMYDGWRKCMQGLCHEWIDTSYEWHELTFEGWFLRNEDYVHVAKRYAEKFCPERMDVVDARLERVTERKRLAMGPKRREESD